MGLLGNLLAAEQQHRAQEQERATHAEDAALIANVHAPADLAAAIRAHPAHRDDLLRQAHARFGNGFVAEALPLIALPDNLARNAAPGALDTNALRNSDDSAGAREINAYNSASVLPFTAQGWDAPGILTKVGQKDNNAATDSDNNRCVQAVGLASHILRGPDAVIHYLQHMLGDNAHGANAPTPRQMSARAVLARVSDRLRGRAATFDDLYWAQEALHDLTIGHENVGTSDDKVASEIAPSTTTSSVALSQWCTAPHEVMAAAGSLAEGQQLVLTAWQVNFNAQINADNEAARFSATASGAFVPKHDWNGVPEERMHGRKKPPAEDIVNGRDTMAGHQLLIVRSGGELRLYEPESSRGGHYLALTAAGLQHYFHDDPRYSTFGYMRLDQKVTPK